MRRNEPSPEEIDDAIDRIIESDRRDRAQKEYDVAKAEKPKKGASKKPARKTTTGEKSPVHVLVDRLGDKPGQYMTTAQVATLLDVSESTIRRLAKSDDGPGPSYYTKMGSTTVALYTKQDIKKIAKNLEDQHKLIPADEVK